MKKVAIGCDPNAADLKEIVKKKLEERREFIERYSSFEYKEWSQDIDFRHKRGLLGEINRVGAQAEQESKLMREALKESDFAVEPVEMPAGMEPVPDKGFPSPTPVPPTGSTPPPTGAGAPPPSGASAPTPHTSPRRVPPIDSRRTVRLPRGE